ncbi:DnaJ protein homolog (DNAJ-1) [Durusdinium trenchii]
MGQNFYAVLCISQSANVDEIRQAFKRRALEVHPDKGGSKESFHRVYQAFETLADAERRQSYDIRLCSSEDKLARVAQKAKSTETAMAPKSKSKRRPSKGPAKVAPKARPVKSSKTVRKSCQLSRIWKLLEDLSREKRFEVIRSCFSQQQRILLEKWMMDKASQTASANEPENSNIQPQSEETEFGDEKLIPPGTDSREIKTGRCENLGDPLRLAGVAQALEGPCEASFSHAESKEAPRLAIQDIPATRRKRGGQNIRCVHSFTAKNGSTYYYATSSFLCVRMQTTTCCDLPTALEFVVVLAAVKERVLRRPDCNLLDRIQVALEESLREHGKTQEQMGLRFFIVLWNTFWFGRRQVVSPCFRKISDLVEAHNRLSELSLVNRKGGRNRIFALCEEQWDKSGVLLWKQFTDVFRSICATSKTPRAHKTMAKLLRIHSANSEYRAKCFSVSRPALPVFFCSTRTDAI